MSKWLPEGMNKVVTKILYFIFNVTCSNGQVVKVLDFQIFALVHSSSPTNVFFFLLAKFCLNNSAINGFSQLTALC